MEKVDYKPFLDLFVGVLFVFLILISAQMFFIRHGDEADRQPDAAVLAERTWRAQVKGFLEHVAGRMRTAAQTVQVDAANASLVVPLDAVVRADAGGQPLVDDTRAAAIAAALAEGLACLRGATKPSPPTACPDTTLLKLDRLSPQIRLSGMPSAAALAPDRFGRLLTALLTAALLRHAPQLLAAEGAPGLPAFRSDEHALVAARPDGDGLAGDLALSFLFARPDGAP
ncbi:hypothetical protein [Chelatococcus reniformis]|uniref:Uncharacterized protein n=1 Tax=Chelatococcus reniformis TaxID=1494448 RepID=A0A916XG82_9HYPH|nr:hypothetical protein [Chelatococcus reniformis]GGC69825.1 hypothetical protein GCM10010994_30480 [Chelatococcus reniformis]